ncbi:MAG: prepilin peptidase [Anaerolineales bacterium]
MDAILLFPLLIGLVAGWLVNYLADVLPDTLRLSRPACPNPDCRQPFGWDDYLLLRRCRSCGRRRGGRAVGIILFLAAMSVYLWGNPPSRLGYWPALLLLAYLTLVALIDLEQRLILRPVSIAGLLICAAAGLLLHGWQSTLYGLAAGFGIMMLFYLIGLLFNRLRARRLGQETGEDEEAFGSGDVTLGALLGLLLGWPLIWAAVLLGLLLYGIISLLIILVLLLLQRYRQQAWRTYVPLGPGFILVAFLMIYFPSVVAALLPK